MIALFLHSIPAPTQLPGQSAGGRSDRYIATPDSFTPRNSHQLPSHCQAQALRAVPVRGEVDHTVIHANGDTHA